jgi:hypothetical protein
LLQQFLKKLETVGETIEDLNEVAKEVAKDVPDNKREAVVADDAAGGAVNFNK